MTRKTSDYDTLMIGALLAIPTQVIGRRVAAALAEQGFTDYRLTYQPVFQWCRPEGSRLTELAERVGITRQSMGEIIDVLEQRGYVERVPDPTDGRAILVRRTPRGWEVNRIAALSHFSCGLLLNCRGHHAFRVVLEGSRVIIDNRLALPIWSLYAELQFPRFADEPGGTNAITSRTC